MRFLGNKSSVLSDIERLLQERGLLTKRLVLFDAFCGSGAVSDFFKDRYDLVINDNLAWAVVYSYGRVVSSKCTFDALGFDPFEYLNKTQDVVHGFMYNNYAPALSCRMYFTAQNALRIDYFRKQIEDWKDEKRINYDEYNYLLSCLVESVSRVSNTAGVYGAYLKGWDARALKDIMFIKADALEHPCGNVRTYNDKVENIIDDVDCDILYLDPPYTQNQYGTQYHLLETLVLNDNPSISAVTGSRPTRPMRSDWSKNYKTHILFDKVIAQTKARYIVISYNNDGFMSKTFIESSLKRYGIADTLVCKKIPYKKYQNWKTHGSGEHFEYLFFIEKKAARDVVYESPLNYIGSKARIVNSIKSNIGHRVTKFIDAFGGGFNVGINIDSPLTIYNDNNFLVAGLVESFKKYDTYEYLMYIKKSIATFGLEKADANSYNRARAYYNSMPLEKRDPRFLFMLILYSYQQQIRFNSKLEFNNPVGMRWFNDCILEKVISFSRRIKQKNCLFTHVSYKDISMNNNEGTFFYMDPPYSLTQGAYNDGKRGFLGWNKMLEQELFDFSNSLSVRRVPFMLSYIMEHKGKQNDELMSWVNKNNYHVTALGDVLGISGSRRKEVLITNYETV